MLNSICSITTDLLRFVHKTKLATLHAVVHLAHAISFILEMAFMVSKPRLLTLAMLLTSSVFDQFAETFDWQIKWVHVYYLGCSPPIMAINCISSVIPNNYGVLQG